MKDPSDLEPFIKVLYESPEADEFMERLFDTDSDTDPMDGPLATPLLQ